MVVVEAADPFSGVLVVIGTILLLFASFLYRNRPPTLKGVPCPPRSGYLGNLPYLKKCFAWKFDEDVVNAERFKKTWYLAVPGRPVILKVFTPECIEHILKTRFDNYVKRLPVGDVNHSEEFFGEGIFAVDGTQWKLHRKVASHLFSTRSLRDYMEKVFVEHAKGVVAKLSSLRPGEVIDMQDIFSRYTMDAMCEIGFGVHLNSVDMEERPEFSTAFDRIQELIILRTTDPTPIFRLKKFFRTARERELLKCASILNKLVIDVIAKRKEAINTDGERTHSDLLSLFIKNAKEKNEPMSDEFLRDVIINFMIAGRDTTACLLTWAFWELAQNPEEEKKYIAEVDEVLAGQTPTDERIKHLSYAQRFLQETLRLHPPVPSDSKKAIHADTLPDGTPVPAGSVIVYMPYVAGRISSNWEEPMKFRPSRWDEMAPPSDFKFVTFNAGPRLCLGKHMAYLEAKILSSMILQKFRLRAVKGHDPIYKASIILQMKNGLRMTVEPRTDVGESKTV